MNQAGVQAAAPRQGSANAVLLSLSLAVLLSSLGTSIANVALPTLAEMFAASFQQVQWVVIAYLLAATALTVSVGRLGDMFGGRRLLLGGIALFTIASLCSATAPSLGLLIAARAVQGIGAAIMLTVALALVSAAIPAGKAGRAIGLLGAMSAVGTALGPSLGGALVEALGWRSIFLASAGGGAIALVLAQTHLPVDPARSPRGVMRFDAAGMLLLTAALIGYALAMTIGRGSFGIANIGLLSAAVALAALFLSVEARAASPLLRLSMFRDRRLTLNLASTLGVAAVIMATLVVGPFYLARGLHLSPLAVGLVMSVGPAVVALSSVPAGRMADGAEAQRMIGGGLACMTLGCVAFAAAGARFGLAGYVAPLALTTFGYSLFQTANNKLLMERARPDEKGLVSGMLSLARNLGLVTGATVMAAVFASASGAADPAHASADAVIAGMRATFAIAGILAFGALLAGICGDTSQGRESRPFCN